MSKSIEQLFISALNRADHSEIYISPFSEYKKDEFDSFLEIHKYELEKQTFTNGNTPLHLACLYNRAPEARKIIDKLLPYERIWEGLNQTNDDGDSPLMIGVKTGNFYVIEEIIDYRYNYNEIWNNFDMKDRRGRILEEMVGQEETSKMSTETKQKIVDLIIKKKISKQKSMETYFIFVCRDPRDKRIHHFQKLLDMGVDINCQNGEGLRRAIVWRKQETFGPLLERPEIKPNLTDSFGNSGLHLACNAGGALWQNQKDFFIKDEFMPVMKLLAHPNILVNERNCNGDTPLMYGVKRAAIMGIKNMLKHPGVDIFLKDKEGRELEKIVGIDLDKETAQKVMEKEIPMEIIEMIITEKKNRREQLEKIEKLKEEKNVILKEINLLQEKLLEVTDKLGEVDKDRPEGNVELLAFIDAMIEEKEKELECPVCLETAQVPIFRCDQCHIICSHCIDKVDRCGECRVAYKGQPKVHRYAHKIAAEVEKLVAKRTEVLSRA